MTYGVEWTPSVVVLGFVALLFVPYLSLFALAVVLLVAAAAFVALAGAVVTAPFLVARSVLRHRHARTAAGHPADRGHPGRVRREGVASALVSADRPDRAVRELPGTRVGVGAC